MKPTQKPADATPVTPAVLLRQAADIIAGRGLNPAMFSGNFLADDGKSPVAVFEVELVGDPPVQL